MTKKTTKKEAQKPESKSDKGEYTFFNARFSAEEAEKLTKVQNALGKKESGAPHGKSAALRAAVLYAAQNIPGLKTAVEKGLPFMAVS